MNPLHVKRLLALLVLLLVLRSLLGSTYRAATTPTGIFGVDFKEIHSAAARLERGEPLYLDEHQPDKDGLPRCQYTCSPLIPLLARPLAHWPLADATKLWVAMNVAALTLAAFLFCWGSGVHLLDSTLAALLVIFTGFRFWPTTIELAIANNHILLLVAVCGMMVCHRYRRWFLLALLVALAALVKTWMLGMIFPLLVARQWRAAGAAVGLFLAGLAILFTITGWSTLGDFITVTRTYSSEPFLISNSVSGIAGMFFTENRHMIAWFPHRGAWLAAMLLGYGTLIGGLWMLYMRGPQMNQRQQQLTIALSVLALILGSPVSHLLYFVLALPVLWSLVSRPWEGRHALAAPLCAFAAYLVLSIPSPCLTPIPESYRTGPRSLLVMMTFLPSFLIWTYGVLLACRRQDAPLPAMTAELLPT